MKRGLHKMSLLCAVDFTDTVIYQSRFSLPDPDHPLPITPNRRLIVHLIFDIADLVIGGSLHPWLVGGESSIGGGGPLKR